MGSYRKSMERKISATVVSQEYASVTMEKSEARRMIEAFYGCDYDEAVKKAPAAPHETELDWGSDVGAEVIF